MAVFVFPSNPVTLAGGATEAKQDTIIATLSTIDADTSTLAGAVSGSEMQVDVVTSALPTGAATEATLSTIDADTSTIAGAVSGTEMQVDVVTSALPTGAATEATLSTIDADTSTLAGAVSGSEMQVDVVTSALPTGAATESTLSTLDSKVTAVDTTGKSTEAKQDDIISALELDVVDQIDTTPLLDVSSSNIPSSASLPLEVVVSTASRVLKITSVEDIGEFIGLYTGAAASEVLKAVLPLGGGEINVDIPASTRISLRHMKASAITSGFIALNFLG